MTARRTLIPAVTLLLALLLPSAGVAMTLSADSVGIMGDSVKRQCVEWGWIHSEHYLGPDMVSRLMERARDVTAPQGERVAALTRLSSYRQERVRRTMVSLLGDGSMPVREASIRGLGILAIPSTVRILIDALRWCRGDCRLALRASLRRITGRDLGDSSAVWWRWYAEHRTEFR